MLASRLAGVILVLHLAFVLFQIFGGLLVVWRARVAWLHFPALCWAVWIEASQGSCPLTPWENALRLRAGESGYSGGFIEHYLVPLIYPPGLTPSIQFGLAALLVSGNALLYVWAWRRARSKTLRDLT